MYAQHHVDLPDEQSFPCAFSSLPEYGICSYRISRHKEQDQVMSSPHQDGKQTIQTHLFDSFPDVSPRDRLLELS